MADWTSARAVADDLAETGVDPLDVQAAQAARVALVRRFLFDLALVFGIVIVVASLVLIVIRAVAGADPLGGNELWLASAGLVILLVAVALRSLLPSRAKAYEDAWAAFVEKVWPGAGKGDELGAARLAFVRRAAAGTGAFPSAAPGRKL